MKSESIKELVIAVLKVMEEVKGIDKSLTVGTGKNSYKGVADKDVKKVIGEAMEKNGLVIFPIEINETSNLSTWDEVDQWSKSTPKDIKRKQSVFTKVNTKYMLCHASGEYITLSGTGHGVDAQDKSAGKATTYALKYALLYTFMVPTGSIDDSDNDHSDNKEVPKTESKTGITDWMNQDVKHYFETEIKNIKTIEPLTKLWNNYKEWKVAPKGMKKEYSESLELLFKAKNIELKKA